mgnify:CR=1 FL=1
MKQWKRVIAGAGAVAAGAAWIGLQQPAPTPLPPAERSESRGNRPLPDGLPEPVRRYLSDTLGDAVPVMDSASAWGTARFRFGPVWTSMRWRAYYVPGYDFYRTLEITWFGQTLAGGYDAYVDGDGVLALGPPLHIFETGPAISQGENMALWAAAPLMPAVFAGARARWEPIDATAAYLRFPSAGDGDLLRAAFDPTSGRIREMTGERYRGQDEKRSWRIRYSQWRSVTGLASPVTIPHRAVVHWADQAQPYGDFLVDGVVYNVDVSEMLPVD